MKQYYLLFCTAFMLVHISAVAQDNPIATLVQPDQNIPKELVKSTREYRERLLADPYRPAFHFCIPEDKGHPGDPNGAFFYNGRYHLITYMSAWGRDSHGGMYPAGICCTGDIIRMH